MLLLNFYKTMSYVNEKKPSGSDPGGYLFVLSDVRLKVMPGPASGSGAVLVLALALFLFVLLFPFLGFGNQLVEVAVAGALLLLFLFSFLSPELHLLLELLF